MIWNRWFMAQYSSVKQFFPPPSSLSVSSAPLRFVKKMTLTHTTSLNPSVLVYGGSQLHEIQT
jgi:hypothetical protein